MIPRYKKTCGGKIRDVLNHVTDDSLLTNSPQACALSYDMA